MASSVHPSRAGFVCVTILAASLCVPARAAEFAGGTGEPDDPYQIATAGQLLSLGADPNLRTKHFILVADIDLDPDLPGGRVFQGAPLQMISSVRRRGSGPVSFEGCLNGRGHVIRNCVIYETRQFAYTGLFESVGQSGQIHNLHIEGFVVVLAQSVGYAAALAGENRGLVSDCSATGTIMTGFGEGGGLIAHNDGIVIRCYARCHVFGLHVGGLLGSSDTEGWVVSCSAEGQVCAYDGIHYDGFYYYTDGMGGGLVAVNAGRIQHCSSGGAAGGYQAGGLVASNAGQIQYCSSDGVVSGNSAGGLVATNDGIVRESYSLASVSGDYCGGLVGRNNSDLVNCHAKGATGGDGLVRFNSGIISSSYSLSASQRRTMSRRSLDEYTRSDCYDLDHQVREYADAGYVPSGRQGIRYLYYLDPNKADSQVPVSLDGHGIPLSASEMERQSSFIGFDFFGDPNDGAGDHWCMPESGYPVLTWQTEITGLTGVPDISGLNLEQARLLLEASGFTPDAVAYDYSRSIPACSDDPCLVATCEDRAWQVIGARSAGYLPSGSPVAIVVSLGRYDFATNRGDGSQSNPYEIETAGQLDSLYGRKDLTANHFVLLDDIDLAGHTYSGALIERFSGTFDGAGHAIRGLHVDYGSDCGLFGVIESGGLVSDLVLGQVRLYIGSVYSEVGMLAGENHGQIVRCTVAGQVLGGSTGVGGLVGRNSGRIAECRVRGTIRTEGWSNRVGGLVGSNTGSISASCTGITISAGDYVGGLAGVSSGSDARIEACYAQGDVQGRNGVGGLLGVLGVRRVIASARSSGRLNASTYADGMSIVRDCYSVCSVTGQSNTAGCIGSANPEGVENCFFLDPADGGGPDNGFGVALSDAAMRQRASFVGWDFDDVWTICEGVDYPRLRWEGTACEQ